MERPGDGSSASPEARHAMRHDLIAYFTLATGFTWLFWIPGALQAQGVLATAIPEPVFFLGGAGPLLAATALTLHRFGTKGVRRLYRPLLRWRVGWGWYAIAVAIPVLVHYAPVLIASGVGHRGTSLWAIDRSLPIVAVFLVVQVAVYSLEEVGWRGYALPRLQERMSALRAGIVVGLGWGIWHLPLLWVPGQYAGDAHVLVKALALVCFIIVMSLLWTWLYNGTSGSLLLANVFHVAVNFSFAALAVPEGVSWMFEFIGPALVGLAIIGALLWRYGGETLAAEEKTTWARLNPGWSYEASGARMASVEMRR